MRESKIHTPCYIVQERALKENLEQLAGLARETGCRILLAQKAFSMFRVYPLIGQYLAGTTASGLYEARLGAECMGKENHIFSPAYREEEMGEILSLCGHVVLNSPQQIRRYKRKILQAGRSPGLRVNPECSTQEDHAIYDPCAPGSRMGVTREVWDQQMDADTLALLDGLHFHTLCEQNADDLATTLEAVEEKFGDVLPGMKWLNMGGGHHITRPDYQMDTLEGCIRHAQKTWGVEVYLEPGEAVALNAGYLVSRVVDLVENAGVHIAILDASAACHMPDVLEMPYQPPILHAVAQPGGAHTYRLAGPTCLAGDVVGDYSFAQPLKRGDLVVFGDMAIYTTCKNNTFNGMPLPDLWRLNPQGGLEQLTQFGYHNFKARLGR